MKRLRAGNTRQLAGSGNRAYDASTAKYELLGSLARAFKVAATRGDVLAA
jgi:hypothetical protein